MHDFPRGSTATPTAVAVPPSLALPVIESSFPRRLHPYWPRLQERTRGWLLEKRLMPADKVAEYADGLCYTDLMAGYYLGAPDEVLQAIADYSAWFFVWDDRHDRDIVHGRAGAWRRLKDRLHTALDSPGDHLCHEDALVAGFADSVLRLYAFSPATWNARFARHFHAVIEAYDREFRNRTRGVVPGVAEYLELRRLTFAHRIWTDLLEPSAGLELPETVRRHPAYRRAALLSQEFAAWYNDLCSLPKELAGDEVHNLGISLITHEGLTLEEAILEIRRRVEYCIDEFVPAERDALRFADELADDGTVRGKELGTAVRACVGNMRNWFSSVYWFHHESGRYRVDSWDDRSTPPYVNNEAAGEK
ncbi:epi-isozizaene synthase [Streptomyces leeuwenhoekii]|uniref:Terpene synthase n=1 Tax=Streptomyces leeuwenhoekii TaxID=1437453 RepID=A0A0F7VP66_STRLW|nr:epi-isozizaene synthase [Streptomyces leeuwenhoekii]KMS80744.1 multidrug MFS transporter [Streptomyces leeuwenhoekii]CQR61979.1 Epi-isozizaene synthase; Albaflavenone biosynthesis [Streptomyces leeuwenhoekii]